MAAGILDYKTFLNLFETTEDVKNTFPRDQHTYTFDFDGLGADGWSAKLTWMTLVVDKVTFFADKSPNFDNGTVIGYFLGGTENQPSGTTMSFPKDMYTGPILPASDYNIPVTVINILWTKDSLTKNKQLLLVQNWEPGVQLGDPTLSDDYIAISGAISTELTLNLESGPVIFGEEFQLSATTTMPDFLSKTASAKFYIKNTGTSTTFIGSATFVNQIATVSVPTDYGTGDPRNINSGTYIVVAVSPSRQQYLGATSNTLTQIIYPGIPIDVSLSLVPSTVSSFNTDVNIIANATTASGYAWPNVAISNTVTFKIIGTDTFPQRPTATITTTTFSNGHVETNLTVTNVFIDQTLNEYSNYTVLSTTGTTSSYTATVQISRAYPIQANWNYYRPGRYSSGTTSTQLNVITTSTFTYDYHAITVQAVEDFGQGNTKIITSATNQTYNQSGPLIKLQASLAHPKPSIFDSSSATVTFTALYTSTFVTDNIPIPNYDLNANPITLLAALDENTFRFDALPEFLSPGDSFLLGSISFTVTSFSTTTNTIVTRYWPGVVNPTIYFGTVITFINNPDAIPVSSEYILYDIIQPYRAYGLTNWSPPFSFLVYRFNKLPTNLKIGDTFTFLSPGRTGDTTKIGQSRPISAIEPLTRAVISLNLAREDLDWIDWRGLPYNTDPNVQPRETWPGMAGSYVQFSSVSTATTYSSVSLGSQSIKTNSNSSVDWILDNVSLNTGTYIISASISYNSNWPIYYRPKSSTTTWKLIVSEPLEADIPSTLLVTSNTNVLSSFNYSGYTFYDPITFQEGTRYLGQVNWSNTNSYQNAVLTLSSGSIFTSTLVTAYWPGNLTEYRPNNLQPKFKAKTYPLSPKFESTTTFFNTSEWNSWDIPMPINVIVSSLSNDYVNNPLPTGLIQYTNSQGSIVGLDTLEYGVSSINIDPSTLTSENHYFSTTTLTATYLGDSIRTSSSSTRQVKTIPWYNRIIDATYFNNYTTYSSLFNVEINANPLGYNIGELNTSPNMFLDLTSTATFKFGFLPGTSGIESIGADTFRLYIRRQYAYYDPYPGSTPSTNTNVSRLIQINNQSMPSPVNAEQAVSLTYDSDNKLWTATIKINYFDGSAKYFGHFIQPITFYFITRSPVITPNKIVMWRDTETHNVVNRTQGLSFIEWPR